MKDNQHEQLFTELTAKNEATPIFKELDDEVAATCSGGKAGVLTLYSNANRTGKKLSLSHSIPDLESFDNITSSITISRGLWAFYADKNYQNFLYAADRDGDGSVPSSANNKISSIKRLL